MDPIDGDFDPPKTLGKRRRTLASGPPHVPDDGTTAPPTPLPPSKPTRKSARVAKGNSKKGTTADLFSWLRQEFSALARTCAELAEVLE